MYHLFPAEILNYLARHECVSKTAKHKKHLIRERTFRKTFALFSLRGKCCWRYVGLDISFLCRTRYSESMRALSCITHGKYGNIGDHFPSPLFAVKPELARELTRVKNPGAVNLCFRDSHATLVTVLRKPYPSFSTYWRQMEHFSEHVAMRDTRYERYMNGTTNVILRIGSNGSFVFIHDAFSLSFAHPMNSRWTLVETGLVCPHLYVISKLETSIIRVY